MLRRAGLIVLMSLLAMGCAEAPPQMEALQVGGAEENDPVAGLLEVSGSNRDFVLRVTSEAETIEVTLHSPGASDLTRLSGKQVELEKVESFIGSDLVLRDERGLLYIGAGGTSQGALESLGAPHVSMGEVVARTREDGRRVAYHELRIETDDGPVALLPGAVETVALAGVPWRFAALAAWRADEKAGPRPRCATMLESLSYELLRLETMDEPTWLDRDPSREIAREGCGW